MSYKILSLDGGGTWAMIQARVLMDLYGNIKGHELLKKFDMVIANSGGSLVLASLCNNMLLSDIVDVFKNKDQRCQVFSKLSLWEKLTWNNIVSLIKILGPRYSAKRKQEGLVRILNKYDEAYKNGVTSKPFVETYLDELPVIIGKPELQLIIVGFDYFRERASFFRSNPNSLTDKFGSGKYCRVKICHTIHASSNAPVNYFDAPAAIDISLRNGNDNRKTWYWDGAVSGFNNPVLAGLIEAITNSFSPLEGYCILSIGTGTGSKVVLTDAGTSSNPDILEEYNKNKNNPLALTDSSTAFTKDVKKLATSILGDPPDSATFIAYSILDPLFTNTTNLVRINPCLKPEKNLDGRYVVPDVYINAPADFEALLELDMDAVKDAEVDLINGLCDKFIVTDNSPCLPNQFIRGGKDGLHLGFGTYKEAKEKWLSTC